MIRLLIADDHPIVREGLKRIVADCADMRVVGEASDGPKVVELCRGQDADVLLMDLSMPGPGFLETMKIVRAMRPRLHVLVMSVHSEEQYAIRSLRAGAAGYLTKDHSPERLEEAIRRVYAGRKYVTTTVAEQLAADLDAPVGRTHHDLLSDREYQVFQGLGRGRSIKQIAHELDLSPKTVSTYRARVLEKMQFGSNADIVRYALRHGLVE